MRKIIAIANQKGGVGKTTTSINLSSSLAHFNRKVLLIDMDPQGNSSRGLGIDSDLFDFSLFDVLLKKKNINEVIHKVKTIKNLYLLPSNLKLANIDSNMNGELVDPFFLLKDSLKDLKEDFDYIIIDCPPSLGFLTFNALVSANSVLIPVQCEYFAMVAVSQILASISRIQAKYNHNLNIEGFLLTMFDSKTRLGIEIATQIRGNFKENTFLSQIPRNISIPESNARGLPVTLYRPTSSGSLAYYSLAKEILDRENR